MRRDGFVLGATVKGHFAQDKSPLRPCAQVECPVAPGPLAHDPTAFLFETENETTTKTPLART